MARKFEIVKQTPIDPDVIHIEENHIEFVQLSNGAVVSFMFDSEKDCKISIDNCYFCYDALLELQSLVNALVKYSREL